MAIFAKPSEKETSPNEGINVLFLHGLEGSPDGAKSLHLKKTWNASVPMLRTDALLLLRAKNPGKSWQEISQSDLDTALKPVYNDVCNAVTYANPDVIIGSSMGGALLAKLIIENVWEGPSIFLAPAVTPLLGDVDLPELKNSVWILGELDSVVSNTPNIRLCSRSRGNLMISKNDSHRLQIALESGLIDNAVVTSLELDKERDSL